MDAAKKLILTMILSPVLLLASSGLVSGFGPLAGVALAAAAPTSTSVSEACQGIVASGGSCDATSSSKSINGVVKAVLDILSTIAGVAAVIMVIIAGFRYITSNGDAQGIAAAKTSLIYAIVGLIIVALAQVIVRFVLSKS